MATEPYSAPLSRGFFYCRSNKAEHIARATLGKTERLKSRKIIDSLFSEGKSIAVFPVRISYKLIPESTATLQAGFSVSSRNFKRAVDRNRIKRLLRETYRTKKAALNDLLKTRNIRVAIFIIYTGKELPAFELVDEKMHLALQKLTDKLV